MKLAGWLVMLTAFIIFLSLMGIPTGLTGILTDLNIIVNPETGTFSGDLENSNFWSNISTLIFVAVAGVGIIIGLFAKGYDVSLVYAPFIAVVGALFLSTFGAVILYVNTFHQWWLTSIIGLIFGSLGIGFIMACVDYFGGR